MFNRTRTASFEATRGVLQSNIATPDGLIREGLYLPVMSGYSEFKPAFDLLSKLRFYSPDPKNFVLPSGDEDRTYLLRSDGSNLANVLHRLRIVDLTRLDRITQYLQIINP